MKFTIVFLVVTILQAKATIFAQKISLNVKDASLTEVIAQIRKQTNVDILYNNVTVANLKPITLNVKNEDLKQVLDKCLANQALTYRVINNSILITAKPAPDVQSIAASEAVAPATAVSGKITGTKGEPLPGVSVKVKNTTTGVASNANGEYKITVPDGSILVFTFIGYETQEVAVNGRSVINLILKEQNTGLDEVVVVGYGTQKQKDLTGSVGFLTSENFNKGPQLTPQQLLQGKIAGVNIVQNSGKPGAANTVRIRGGTSVTSTNDPLYVVDGVPLSVTAGTSSASIGNQFDQEPINPLQTINPNDIESMSVLKDASATAIYGSRGANGVIVITTKSGKVGRAQVSYNGIFGASNVANKLSVLSADEYRGLIKSIPSLANRLDDKGENTNWQDKIFRTGYSNDHNISLSGGAEKTSYRVSLGYGKQQGIVLNSDLEQANVLASFNHKALDDRLKFDLKLNYGQNNANVAPISNAIGGESGSSMNFEAYVFNPTYPVYNPSGAYYHVPAFRINPVSFSTDLLDRKLNQRILGNLTTSYKIIDPLSLIVSLGYTRQSTDRNAFISKSSPLGNGFNGQATVQKYYDYSKLSETILKFNKNFGKHYIEALGGYSYQYFFDGASSITAQGFQSDDFKWYNLGSATNRPVVSSGAGSSTLISMYSRVNYNFDERFLFTGTLRRDGSSRFGANHKWGYFPSGSVAWRLSQEKFFNVKPISDLKLRVSYGETGNQEIGNLNSLVLLNAGGAYIVGGQVITLVRPGTLANPDLRWESTAQLNIGINFGLFNDRLHGSVDWYRKKTSNLLLQVPVVQPSIATTQLANVGSVENKGIEVELGATVIEGKNFTWNADFNITHNENKVLSLSNDVYKGANIPAAPLLGTVSLGNFAQIIMPGYPLGTFYGKKFTGVDANGMETYESNDSKVLGNAQPKFTYGFSNNFSYKQFSLGFNLRGVLGNTLYNATANNLGYKKLLPGRNVLRSTLNDGVSVDQSQVYSSRWLESGSFLRMDNATLGYTVKLKTAKISSLRVFLTGQNLFVITKYSGLDPEVNAVISGAPIGVDYLGYPRAKTFSIGANITFQ